MEISTSTLLRWFWRPETLKLTNTFLYRIGLCNYFWSWFKSFGLLDKTSIYDPISLPQSSAKSNWLSHNFFTIFFLKKIRPSLFYLVILHALINSDFKRKLGGSLQKLGREVWNIYLFWIDILSIVTINCFILPYLAKTKGKSSWRNLLLFLQSSL